MALCFELADFDRARVGLAGAGVRQLAELDRVDRGVEPSVATSRQPVPKRISRGGFSSLMNVQGPLRTFLMRVWISLR
jgi:hypothetical protein